MQYSAQRKKLLHGLGAAVRARRNERGLTMKTLAEKAHVSVRFLVQVEGGEGNVSVARLEDIAEALDTTGAELLTEAAREEAPAGIVALVGLRGAGKSSIGQVTSDRRRYPFQ